MYTEKEMTRHVTRIESVIYFSHELFKGYNLRVKYIVCLVQGNLIDTSVC